ncbi:enoyl-CoA hydratase/isomerase family protein, partial [Klebsiella pneumoniae]|nr:enoyl-CoA hydratase/isomerase family protein [Klebsiella pneumoniae]
MISTDVRVGRISLNRPKAIHALNLGMCQSMIDALLKWRADDTVKAVVIEHSEGRGFCAGGDIRSLYDSFQRGDTEHETFFEEEYALDQYIHAYPKPLLALMDGFVLGGGMGLVQ